MLKSLETQLEYCLKQYPETRNSDVKLYNTFLIEFYQDKVKLINNEYYIKLLDLYELPTQSAVVRIRAKIQNIKLEYLPTNKEIAKQRGWEEEKWRKYLGYNPELRQPSLI